MKDTFTCPICEVTQSMPDYNFQDLYIICAMCATSIVLNQDIDILDFFTYGETYKKAVKRALFKKFICKIT